MIERPSVQVDLRKYFKGEASGHHDKMLIVLHETVSFNSPGVLDIKNPAAYLDAKGYEIHGIVDAEGNSGWCYDAKAIYDHAKSANGMVNERSVGFELVSNIPLMSEVLRYDAWLSHTRELDKVAWWVAWLCEKFTIPIQYSDSSLGKPGITSHWDVSYTWKIPDGHWDCWPKHKGGYFPLLYVVNKAKQITESSQA